MNAFRLRVFVDPPRGGLETSWGAVQDLESMVALAVRIRRTAGDATLLLSLHYSDTWADPQHQKKPAAWDNLHGPALEQQVESYTASVVRRFREAEVTPEYVQVGNEVTGGMLWPDGKVIHSGTEAEKRESWERFGRLLAAGARGVKSASPLTRVVVHSHGGGVPGLPAWFFGKVVEQGVRFDAVGLSFYPSFGDKLPELRKSAEALSAKFGAEILIVETSYPWRDVTDLKDRSAMTWPQTQEGQARYWSELSEACHLMPGCTGVLWWYPEAVPPREVAGEAGQRVWRDGAESLFTLEGMLTGAGRLIAGSGGAQQNDR
jgi:arabinogalactan endo-1,4-beta-galactosidase